MQRALDLDTESPFPTGGVVEGVMGRTWKRRKYMGRVVLLPHTSQATAQVKCRRDPSGATACSPSTNTRSHTLQRSALGSLSRPQLLLQNTPGSHDAGHEVSLNVSISVQHKQQPVIRGAWLVRCRRVKG